MCSITFSVPELNAPLVWECKRLKFVLSLSALIWILDFFFCRLCDSCSHHIYRLLRLLFNSNLFFFISFNAIVPTSR